MELDIMQKSEIVQDTCIVFDFIVSIIGGILKNSSPMLAEKMFLIGAFFLFVAIGAMLVKYVTK